MKDRRKTRTVTVGGVRIGSGNPVSIQSMTKTDTSDITGTIEQIASLEKAGCEIVRVAVKDINAARAIRDIKKSINIPLVADIHFDHKLAIEAIRCGADKIRLNPGNIGKTAEIDSVIDEAGANGVPVRIGVNSGSLTENARGESDAASAMVGSVLRYIERFRLKKFEDIIISLKSSEVAVTIDAYKKMAGECDYPFHLGVTAAGPSRMGTIKGAMGIGSLLLEGIGDTIRVSLTGDPVREILVARDILAAADARSFGPVIISCPVCGRCQTDLVPIVEDLERGIRRIVESSPAGNKRKLVVAVMGCEVNGPGEAKSADLGIAFGKGKGAIFSRGKILRTVDAAFSVKELLRLIESELEL